MGRCKQTRYPFLNITEIKSHTFPHQKRPTCLSADVHKVTERVGFPFYSMKPIRSKKLKKIMILPAICTITAKFTTIDIE